MLILSAVLALLVFTIATFPGEWLNHNVPAMPLVSAEWTPYTLLVAGEVDEVARRPRSLWSNRLVVPGIDAIDRAKFDSEAKIAAVPATVSLRGRRLEGAVLKSAMLRKADFTGAQLSSARLDGADLRETRLECAFIGVYGESPLPAEDAGGHGGFGSDNSSWPGPLERCANLQGTILERAQLQGASLEGAQLQGARLVGAQLQGARLNGAQLQGASLDRAQLQGVSLDGVQLRGASLEEAQLQGARLDGAHLQGARLDGAQLQGARLNGAQLQGASLDRAQLQGVSFFEAQLRGASLVGTFVWRADAPQVGNATDAFVDKPQTGRRYQGLDCARRDTCEWSGASYIALQRLIEDSVTEGDRRKQALARIAILDPEKKEESDTATWAELEKNRPAPRDYLGKLASILQDTGCNVNGAPYVIKALTSRLRWELNENPTQASMAASAFLDETKCPGARGLSETAKAELREIRDDAPLDSSVPAPASKAAQ